MPRPNRDGTPAADPNKRNLTENFLKKLKPQPRKFVVWDEQATRARGPRPSVRIEDMEVRLQTLRTFALASYRSRGCLRPRQS